VKLNKCYLDLAKSVSKSKILPDKDDDLSNSLSFLKEIIKKQMTETSQSEEVKQDASGLSEINISIDKENVSAWKSVVSPLIAFETEYDLKMTDSATKESVPSFLFAKAAYNSQGKDC